MKVASETFAQLRVNRAMQTVISISVLLVVSYSARKKRRVFRKSTRIVPAAENQLEDAGRVRRSRSMFMAPACRSLRNPLDNSIITLICKRWNQKLVHNSRVWHFSLSKARAYSFPINTQRLLAIRIVNRLVLCRRTGLH